MVEPEHRDDFPAKIAGLLEDIARRIREMTVDRVATAVTWTAVGIVLAVLAFLVLFWVLVALFRALGTLIGQELAYAAVGVLLVAAGAFLWSRRFTAKGENDVQE